MDDRVLISSLINGDNESYKLLIENYKDKIYNTSFGILQDYNDAEDIVQEVFIEVFQSIGNFRRDSKLSTWIYRITVRKSIDELRKEKERKVLDFYKDYSILIVMIRFLINRI